MTAGRAATNALSLITEVESGPPEGFGTKRSVSVASFSGEMTPHASTARPTIAIEVNAYFLLIRSNQPTTHRIITQTATVPTVQS
jgi:hypothetical protein